MNLSKPHTLRSLSLVLSSAAIATFAIACSGSGSSGGGEPSGSNAAAANSSGSNSNPKGSGGSGGTTGQDAGGGKGGGGADDGGVTPKKAGFITVSQTYNPTTKAWSHTSTAAFVSALADLGAVGASGCTTTTEGICQVTTCPPPKPVEAGAPPPPVDAGIVVAPNAGKLILSGPTLATDISLIPYTDTGLYPSKSAATQAWNGGDAFGFEALGNDVKSFNAQVTAPAQLTVTGPTPTNGIYSFSRKADFVVTFTGGDATTQGNVQLMGTDDDKNTISAVCTAPTKGGTIVIPVDAVSYFGTKGSGAFLVSTSASKVLKSSGYDVTLSLAASALAGAFTTSD